MYHEQGGYPQNYSSANNEHNIVDDDDVGSMNSADPPGTSYRDLPAQEKEDWDDHHSNGMMMMAPPPSHEQMQHMMNPSASGFTEEYLDHDSLHDGSFHVYESESIGSGLNDLNDSYQSRTGHNNNIGDVDNQSNPGSYHSGQSGSGSHGLMSSNRSYHSQGSRHSTHSNRSLPSQDSRHSGHSNHSPHTQDEGSENQQHEQQQDYDQYVDDGGNFNDHANDDNRDYANDGNQDFADDNKEYVDNNNYDEDRDGHSNEHINPLPYQPEYDQYNVLDDGANNIGNDYMDDNHNMVSGGQFDNNAMMEDESHQYGSSLPGGNHAGVYHNNEHHQTGSGGVINNSFDEQSYHSFNPIPSPNSALSRPEELDEVSHSGSAYTAATQQISNTTSNGVVTAGAGNGNPPTSQHQQQRGASYGEEEESITNIFKSLSEIQTRLASKGKQQQPLPIGALTQNDVAARSKTRKNPGDVYAPSYQPPFREGIVEDGEFH